MKINSLLARFFCWVFFHDLRVVKKLSLQCDKLLCARCNRYYAINYSVRAFLPYNEVRELYEGPLAEQLLGAKS